MFVQSGIGEPRPDQYRGRVPDSPPAAQTGLPASASDTDPELASESTVGSVRYRCTACGNLTRFDVVTSRRTRAFHHYSLGGELEVEDVEVLDELVEGVSCRWCGHGNAVEALVD